MSRKILTFCFVIILLSAGHLQAATPDPVSGAEWRRAENLLVAGQAEESYRIFSSLLQKYPGHSSLLLGLARSSALTRRYQQADDLYRDLLSKYPNDPLLLNESDQVKALMSGKGSATTFNFRMRAGLIYDSNANQGAETEVVQVFPNLNNLQVTFRDTKKISTTAAYFGANFNMSHRLNESGPWSFVGDAGLYIRGNRDSDLDDIKSSEWQWFRLGAGLRYTKERNLFEFRLKYEIFDYELTNHVTAWGPELTYLRAVTPNFHLISQLALDWRNYQRNPDRDGTYGQLAQYGRFFFGENAHSLTVGAAYLWGRPERRSLGHYGWSAPVRLTLHPHTDWEISPNASYTAEYYRGPAIILDEKDRRDKRIRTGVDVIYKLTENWRLEFNYSYNKDNSNSPLYDYKQHVVGLGMSWGF
ncbi:MAG: surface lipoprotein assembly modifier [Deltaproteobacteria bacterium]|jgi:tetratricopeptide (TPR) repeat protein|nr:surface lipoprotein assembly modifier [Deltaproteobacteria bacterium]